MTGKRLPKPLKTRAIRYYIQAGIPFLNAPADAIPSCGQKLLDLVRVDSLTGEGLMLFSKPEEWPGEEARELYLEARNLSRIIVDGAANKHPYLEEDRKKIQKAIDPLKPCFSSGQITVDGNMVVVPFCKLLHPDLWICERDSIHRVLVEEKGILTLIVAFTLSTFKGAPIPLPDLEVNGKSFPRDGTYISPAAAYIGLCPRCAKVFEKLQKNMEFCSKKCGNASRQETFREKVTPS